MEPLSSPSWQTAGQGETTKTPPTNTTTSVTTDDGERIADGLLWRQNDDDDIETPSKSKSSNVNDDIDDHDETSTPSSPPFSCCFPYRFWILSIVIAALLIVVGVGVGVAVVGKNDKQIKTPTTSPITDSPTMAPTSSLLPLVVQYSSSNDVFDNPTSPQSQALKHLEEIVSVTVDTTEEKLIQRYALAVLYHSTRGDFWTNSYNFLDPLLDPCEWNDVESVQGVFCDEEGGGQVTSIHLVNNGLRGFLPQELVALTVLDTLVLSSNRLLGPLPDLNFLANSASSSSSSSLSKRMTIRHLDLQGNQLEGSIPMEFLLSSYESLNLSVNRFSGSLPTTLQFLTNLRTLNLAQNSVTGKHPSIIFMTQLTFLALSGNQLLGSIPEIWPGSLQFADLSANSLEGTLPLAAVSGGMQFLNVNDNALTGTLPFKEMMTTDSSSSSLQLLWLRAAGNQLTGSIPWDVLSSRVTSLQLLELGENRLTGTIGNDDDLESLPWLGGLDLRSNLLNGTIPTGIGKLTLLRDLALGDNVFSGTLPTELGNLHQLRQLEVKDNLQLIGTIPTELEGLEQLQIATFDVNGLEGTVDFLCPMQTLLVDCETITCSCCEDCQQ